ncbi:hypothetical protein RRG08_030352 [Elysia crispata]|uniref:Uncharacterized protein n=1 Tax=Elysia crispata TaxID=231223 RepID=A0AAE0YI94_9GAST|nr:hypothetical protein RRG08_030352 [Elysia crispata]
MSSNGNGIAPEGAYIGRNGVEDTRSIELRSVNGPPGVNGATGVNGVNKVDPEDVEIKTGKKKKESEPVTGVFEVFRFSDWKDRVMMVVGAIAAAANGAALPAMIIIFGEMIETFVDTGILADFLDDIPTFLANVSLTKDEIFKDVNLLLDKCVELSDFYGGNKTCEEINIEDRILDEMTTYAIYYSIIGGGVLVCGYLQVTLWMLAAERQAHRIRKEFLQNILRQDIGWFDTHEAAELNTRLADDVAKIQDGIGDKIGTFVQWIASFFAGFAIGFVYGWKLTLVILAVSPMLVGAAFLFSQLAASLTSKELEAYAKAGAVAEEVFGAIRTVVAFGGQEVEANRYYNNLGTAQAFGIKKGFTNGASMGFIWFVIFGCYALGFWYGGKLVREDDDYSVATMIIVFFSVLIGAFSLGNAFPALSSLSTARGAAYVIFKLIDQKSAIDSSSEEGQRPERLRGLIQMQNVHFNYPSRPDVKVLNGLDLVANPGQTVALVGSSGCGKSTTVQLMQRFYDPLQGKVMIDGIDLRDLNIKWLRSHIGVVSQEPVLFATTIAENIRYGKEDVTMDEIIQACKNANAYDFIMSLPNKFETLVGERGAQLSGGQKQRVAIARALVRDPKILLLDEATSALDTESESIVQDALDKAREGRTTLVIAHRLSTIKTADIIVGFNQGVATERGTHSELMAKQGIYYQLVTSQTQAKEKEEESDDEEIEASTKSPEKSKKLQRGLSVDQSKQEAIKTAKDEEEELKKLPDAPFRRLIRMNSPEWFFILLGCFGSIVNGGVQPAFAIIFSEILDVFREDEDTQKDRIFIYSMILLGLGLMSLVTMFLQGYMFGRSGEALTTRLRDITFRSMMRQDIAFFDDSKNSVGALTTRLATDASLVQGVTGVRLGSVLMNVANMGTAIIISFIYSWKLTLLIIAFMPFIVLGGLMQIRLLTGQAGQNKEALEGAGKVAVECIENVRTVASLLKEPKFFELYLTSLEVTYQQSLRRAHLVGFTYAFSQAIIYFAYAAAFVLGAYLIEERELEFGDVFLVFAAIVFGAMGLGNASGFAPDVGKAQNSAKRILALIDSVPTLDYTSTDGSKLPANYQASIQFKSVHFHYPTRSTVPVLQGLSCSVVPGQTLAFVGSSGCGKSTSVQLIERFYDPIDGSVNLHGHDMRSLNLQWLRQQIGIVSQEPVLFDRSIAENIAYGDNTRVVGMEEIIEAAKGANIHNFISELPSGYDTNVGAKGTQLSGGQKQRVAIARALVRNPKILLLDEATSALDTESEKIVQEALDKARQGRTCVVIAHRLSTIKNADTICVVSSGKVSEEGTHSELMAKQGFYYKLVQKSTRKE